MKKLLTAALFVIFIAGQAHADALWYALENGSKVDLTDGTSVSLTGRIALAGCGKEKANIKGAKILYPIYALRFDNLPEMLVSHLNDSSSHIALFGGAGGVDVSGNPSLIANRDGMIFSVDWVLQHQLEQDYGNEAMNFNRTLTLDAKQKSSLSFRDKQQYCPDTISLNLVVKDIHRTFVPRLRTSSKGVQSTDTVTSSHKEDIIGHVTIVAKAIPFSEQKIDDAIDKHMKVADDVRIGHGGQISPPQSKYTQPIPLNKPASVNHNRNQPNLQPETVPSNNNAQTE